MNGQDAFPLSGLNELIAGVLPSTTEAFCLVALLAALVSGMLGFRVVSAWRAGAAKRMARREALGDVGSYGWGGIEGIALSLVARLGGFDVVRGSAGGRAAASGGLDGNARLDELIRRSGLEGRLSSSGVARARPRLCALCLALGVLVGAPLSVELAATLAVFGLAVGWVAPTWALRRCERERTQELERCLPEMLEVVALGMRSGLSFDRSFLLYGSCFPSAFAQACVAAQRSWALGLRTRDEALRELATSYSSEQLSRVVERVIRALRFGSALAPDLEAAAAEARSRRKALVEERVAKAPVKMMVPTGALILPAMLLLVLGPVLLELMQGV